MKYKKGDELKNGINTIKILKVEDGYYIVQRQDDKKEVSFSSEEECFEPTGFISIEIVFAEQSEW